MRSAALRPTHFACALMLTLLASGCSSTRSSSDELAANRPRPAPAEKYPDFSRPLESAMVQMSDEEAARQQAQLSVLARQRQSGRITEAEYKRKVAELRALAAETE